MGENVLTSPHLFPCFIERVSKGKKDPPSCPEWTDLQGTGHSSSYLTKLRACRAELTKNLANLATDAVHLESCMEAYTSLACPMLPQLVAKLAGPPAVAQSQSADAAPTGNEMDVGDVGEELQGAGNAGGAAWAGGGGSHSVAAVPPDAYHSIGTFTWRNTLLSLANSCWSSRGGLAMDVGYLLLSNALWHWAKASHTLQQHGKTIPSEPVLQAFKLLRHAIGCFSLLRNVLLPTMLSTLEASDVDADTRQKLLQPTLGDLSPHLLEGLQAACCADAQSLSLLRACNKEGASQSASLIASIAHDTAGLYAAALLRIDAFACSRPVPGTSLTPSFPAPPNGGAIVSCNKDMSGHSIGAYAGVPRELGAYCRYKFAACRAYALSYAALTGLRKEEKAGWAVRVAQEAAAWQEKAIKKLGAESDKSTKRKEAERAAFDAELESQVQGTLARLQRDNDGVYFKRVPAQMPDEGEVLPQGRRVVEAAPLQLPVKPPEPYSFEDVMQLLNDCILSSAKDKADQDPLPPPPKSNHAHQDNGSSHKTGTTEIEAAEEDKDEGAVGGQAGEAAATDGGRREREASGPQGPKPAEGGGGKKKEAGQGCCCCQ